MVRGLDLCDTNPAQRLRTAGEDPDDLDRDLSVRGVIYDSIRCIDHGIVHRVAFSLFLKVIEMSR